MHYEELPGVDIRGSLLHWPAHYVSSQWAFWHCDLKSWFPLTFRTPRYFILQFWSSSLSLIPSDDTYLVWTAVDPVACLLYLDREVESWSGCGCPGGPWGQVVHATSLRQSNQVNICYIYIIYIIYSILILTGLDLLAACFVWIAWFYGESILPLSEFSCI